MSNNSEAIQFFKATHVYGNYKFQIEDEVSLSKRIECFTMCIHDDSCDSFAYNTQSKMCRLLSMQATCVSNQHEQEDGWKYYMLQEIH